MYQKTFRHNLVEAQPLVEETTEKGRWYIEPNGTRLRSVTTVLGDAFDKTWLIEWKRRVGAKEASRVSRKAMARGSIVHGICERYVNNDENYLKDIMPMYFYTFAPIKELLDEHVDDIYGIELPLYSLTLMTAGRTDLVAKYDGVPSIIDYKTSKKLKTEGQILSYFLQSTVYSMMFERTYRISIPQIVIVITVDDEIKPQVFVRPRGIYVEKVLEIFKEEVKRDLEKKKI